MEEDKETENKITFWKDGDYVAKGGIFVRNDLKVFFNTLIEKGYEPVGIVVDLESFNMEIIAKVDEA
tara:strand:- start:207 stop:407 length:201 start_codon:yes stop_codon:yes gene_type:complete